MNKRILAAFALSILVSVQASCEKSASSSPADSALPDTAANERPQLSVAECEAKGVIVGDPGDGRTHRPDFRCDDGSEPLGNVASGIEGAACCPTPKASEAAQ
jgi:hypothetical protein